MNWFRLNHTLHRDAGYLTSALLIVYAVSGVALNHTADFNPSYSIDRQAVDIGPFSASDVGAAESLVVDRLRLERREIRGRFRSSEHEFQVFLEEGGEARLDPTTGRGTLVRVARRPVLFEVNLLHRNTSKGAWTIVADAAAVLLLYLAVSGLFMVRGRRGIWGRGKWFFGAGVAVPIVFLVLYYRG